MNNPELMPKKSRNHRSEFKAFNLFCLLLPCFQELGAELIALNVSFTTRAFLTTTIPFYFIDIITHI